ncbi:manganese efflux pump [Lachnospiraceae bacterium LCP25S3_G4]
MFLELSRLASIMILIIALSLDMFVASIAYGVRKIKVKFSLVMFISLICSGCLGVALWFGALLDGIVPETLTKTICCLSLLVIGLIKMLDYKIKSYVNKHNEIERNVCFSISKLRFMLTIYANPTKADKDESNTLSVTEAVFLAGAMSVDGLVAGVGAGFWKINIIFTILLSVVINALAIMGGCYMGNKIAIKTDIDLSWLSGALFIILAIAKLL